MGPHLAHRLALASCLLLLLAGRPVAVGAAPAAQAGQPPAQPTAAPPDAPTLLAHAAVAIDAATGAVLYEQNAHEHLPPASLTKMVTAMVSLERSEPSATITATENSLVEPSIIGLAPGDELPLREALYGLLLNSGNDAALAIAETVGGGSIPRFVDWMNDLVAALGLQDTHFANPHGLDIGDHYSSAYDMAVIGRALLRQPLLRTIVATPAHTFDGPPLWAFHNINPMLASYPGADGLKTGYETRAGHCLAVSATHDGRQVIAVVLDSNQYVTDGTRLLDYAFARLAQPAAPVTAPPDRGRAPGPEAPTTGREPSPQPAQARLDGPLYAGPTSVFDRLAIPRPRG